MPIVDLLFNWPRFPQQMGVFHNNRGLSCDNWPVKVAPILAACISFIAVRFPLDPPPRLLYALPTGGSPAPNLIFIAWLALPECVLFAYVWVVGEYAGSKHWAFSADLVPAPETQPYAVVASWLTAFKARIPFPHPFISAVFYEFLSSIANLQLEFSISCTFEGIFVSPVYTVVDPPILYFSSVNALPRDTIFFTVAVLLAASQVGRALAELGWALLLLPFLFLAPCQLSLTARVASTDGRSVSATIFSVPLPLLDTDTGVCTGCHMGSATEEVSVFVRQVFIACMVAALAQIKGDATGADDW